MDLQTEKMEDEGSEKHKPVIERGDSGAKVKIGSLPHPMEDEHFIQWVEASSDGLECKRFLKPGDSPAAEFEKADFARAYCNIHGLWKS
jgi:superoxide reductase